MLISQSLEQAINDQIGREFGASLQYVSIAAYFDSDDLPNLAAFFYRQADEEHMHAMKFLHYLVEAGAQARIPAVGQPKHDFKTAVEAAEAALEWENEVTRQINNLMDMAIKDNDHIAQDFLRWFVAEQLEEISTMQTLLSILNRSKDNLLFADDYLARYPIVEEGAEADTGDAA
jgi:ferritin